MHSIIVKMRSISVLVFGVASASIVTPHIPDMVRDDMTCQVEELLQHSPMDRKIDLCSHFPSSQMLPIVEYLCESLELCDEWFGKFGKPLALSALVDVLQSVCNEFRLIFATLPAQRMDIRDAVQASLNTGSITLGENRFHLLDTLSGERANCVVARAIMNDELEVALKCQPAGVSVRNEYNYFILLQDEPWCPKVYSAPVVAPTGLIRCYAMELFALGDLASEPARSWSEVAQIGLHMATILDELHTKHHVAHRDAHPKNWMRDSNGGLFLIDFEYARPITKFPHGIVTDALALVCGLRYMRNTDPRFGHFEGFRWESMERICPENISCPSWFVELVHLVQESEALGEDAPAPADLFMRIIQTLENAS
jgi:serine/threonine protein kinase